MALLDKVGPNGDLLSSRSREVAPAGRSEVLGGGLERGSQRLMRGGRRGVGEEVGR